MSKGLITLALKRQQERPDIHKPVVKVNRGSSLDDSVPAMVHDLKSHLPKLSIRQLSTLIGVSTKTIFKNLPPGTAEPAECWSEENNATACADSLSALRKHHPGGFETQTDFTSITLAGMMPGERTGPVAFTAPDFRDRYRRADQSHTIKRPITLATQPYSVAA